MMSIELLNRYSLDFDYDIIKVYDNFKKINYITKNNKNIDFKHLLQEYTPKYTKIKQYLILEIYIHILILKYDVCDVCDISEEIVSPVLYYIHINKYYNLVANNITSLYLDTKLIKQKDLNVICFLKCLESLHLTNTHTKSKIYYNLNVLKTTKIKKLYFKNLVLDAQNLRISSLKKLKIEKCEIFNLDLLNYSNIKYLTIISLNIQKIPYLPFLFKIKIINCDIKNLEILDKCKYLYQIYLR